MTIFGLLNLRHATELCNIKDTGCDWKSLDKGYLLGYAYHPNGELWLMLDEELDGGQNFVHIFTLDIETCTYTHKYTITLPFLWQCFGSSNIDYLGRLYLHISENNGSPDNSIKSISRIEDPSNPVIERLLTFSNDRNPWEIHFEDNKVYLPEFAKQHIYVYDMEFNILDTIIMPKLIFGLTSFTFGCDSITTYASHYNISSSSGEWDQFDSTLYIAKYDIPSNTLIPLCNININSEADVGRLTSPLEFLSSDPECDLLIDLDRDNSSGVYPYDFYDSTTYCTTVETSVCDNDVYIHSSAPIDSIVILLSGIKELGEEQLFISGLPSELQFTQITDSSYILKSVAIANDSIYRDALLNLRYEHIGQKRTAGERRIIMQGFNAIKEGTLIKAQLFLSGLPDAGKDATLLVCKDTIIQPLSMITQGQDNGSWEPGLISGEDIFNSAIDLEDQYAYIVSDPQCGSDTAIITIIRDQIADTDLLGPDQKLCPEDTIQLTIEEDLGFILWENGSYTPERTITEPGTYQVTVATNDGCEYSDNITIQPADILSPDYEVIDPSCGMGNGSIMIDPSDFNSSISISLNNIPLSGPEVFNLMEGDYLLTTLSEDNCTTDLWISLEDSPTLGINMDTLIQVEKNSWVKLFFSFSSGIAPEDVIFSPDSGIRWNGNYIEVFGESDRVYEITFVDANDCEETIALQVRVDKGDGIYIPNIFNPYSNSGNDIWKPFFTPRYQFESLEIFDRWGNEVYASTSVPGWDGTFEGKNCSQGVFVFKLMLLDINNGMQKVVVGDVTLIH